MGRKGENGMRTLIGLTLAATIGSCVIGLLLNLTSTIQAALNNAVL